MGLRVCAPTSVGSSFDVGEYFADGANLVGDFEAIGERDGEALGVGEATGDLLRVAIGDTGYRGTVIDVEMSPLDAPLAMVFVPHVLARLENSQFRLA
jgi:hypothetical protein